MTSVFTSRSGFRLAFRANFPALIFLSCVVLILAAVLSAQFSGRQPATVALDVGLSTMRLMLPLVLVLVVQELVSREFERRYFLMSLSYPWPRHLVLFGRFLTVVVLIAGLLCLMAALLAMIVWWVGQGYEQGTPVDLGVGYLITVAFIGVDLLVLISLAFFLAVVASVPSFVLIGTFGFMLIARSFSAIIELLTYNSGVVGSADEYRKGVGLLGYLLPDLGGLDVRAVALYGTLRLLPPDWPWLILSSLAYSSALFVFAVCALRRKRFS